MRKLLALLSALASPALAQTPAGVINAPIYATGYISQVGGTNVTTNIPPQPNHPTNLNIYTTGAISGTWTIKLPNPAFEGQMLSFNCGAAANAISVTSSDGSSIDSTLPTACSINSGFTIQFDQRSNIWRNIGSNNTSTFKPFTGVASQWPWQLNADGSWILKQPQFSDLAGTTTQLFGTSNTWTAPETFTLNSLHPTQTNGGAIGNNGVCTGLRCAFASINGGYGSYGIDQLTVDLSTGFTPLTGAGYVARSSWISASNSPDGTSDLGSWIGVNSPSQVLGHSWGTNSVGMVGAEVNFGNRWGDLSIVSDIGVGKYTVGMQIVPDVIPTSQGSAFWSVSGISAASPGAVTMSTTHNFTANMGVVFFCSGTCTLPSPLVAGATYYVSGSITGTTFQLSAVAGSSSLISTSGTMSGTVLALPSYPGSFGLVLAHSNYGNQIATGSLLRYDTIQPNGFGSILHGNYTSATNQPNTALKIDGYWANGIDLSGATFSGAALSLKDGHNISWGNGSTFIGGSAFAQQASVWVNSAEVGYWTPSGWNALAGAGGSLSGSSSGKITFQAQAASGTYNWNWPTTAGTSGQLLASGGGGTSPMSWQTLGTGVSSALGNAVNTSGGLATTNNPVFTGTFVTIPSGSVFGTGATSGTTYLGAGNAYNDGSIIYLSGATGGNLGALSVGGVEKVRWDSNPGVGTAMVRTTAAVPAASSCGTGSAVDANSSAAAGKFTIGTGATACTLTFAVAYPTSAFCTVTPAAQPAAVANIPYISAQSRTAFTISGGTASTSYYYTCGGN